MLSFLRGVEESALQLLSYTPLSEALMTAIQISDELAAQIEQSAQRAGESSADFIREAVLSRLEDMEDIALATERLKNPGETISLEELKKSLGLDA
jgi:RHH-type transcriptional regulator, rel operon repressor / antitoxin RelB